jgi:hypothetical protein
MPVSTPPLAVHKSALRRPTPAFRVAISVSEACEELWSVQDGNQAQPWLQMLHSALLRDRVDAYNPSDAFLCIQGAALNFPQTWEYSLWAAAALVRVCVGPAWRVQRHEELMMASAGHPSQSQHPTQMQSSTTLTTLSDSTGDESSPRPQQSPRSYSPLSIDPQQLQPSYPYIPEVLPAALLRFAASAPMESRSLAEAQRELVLALCCISEHPSSNFDRSRPEWNIPGAHKPVEIMMRFWLESISVSSSDSSVAENEEEKREIKPIKYSQQQQQQENESQKHQQIYPIKFPKDELMPDLVNRLSRRTLDWWSTLLVARACSDLVSVGWRPYEDHSAIVMHLLNIAKQGIALRHISPTATDQESREQRLAATSSAAEAIAALASSGELLPCTASPEVVVQLLALQLAAGKTSRFVHSQYPTGTPHSLNDEEEFQQERETFLSQRTSCFSDTAHSLWVLLAHESSAVLVMSTLLDNVEDDLERAAVVVRIVSGALWGKPPNVPGISTLRIYWKHFLSVLAKLANIFVASANARTEEMEHQHDSHYRVNKLSMTLTLEVVVALGRLVEIEMVRGRGILAKDEWQEFNTVLEAIVIPCLKLEEDKVVSRYVPEDERALRKPQNFLNRIRSESETVLLKVGEYLEKCCRFEVYQCHLIVYDDCRDALHLMLLRRAVPAMINGASLGIKVLRSWATAGFSPGRGEIWIQVATDLVADAFAVYDDHSSSKYGGYVHSPRVRLEAIGLLSSDEAYANLGKGRQDNHASEDVRVDAVFLGSPLRGSRFFPDEHHDLIRSAILPCLSLVFNRALSDDNSGQVLRFSSCNSEVTHVAVNDDLRELLAQSAHEDPQHLEGRFKLRKYCIDLVGRLFCTATEYRTNLIGLLEDAAKMKPHTQAPTEIPDKDNQKKDEGEEELSVFETNRSLLSLEAIGQLESCLCAPFFSIASAHESFPTLIQALCSILQHSCSHQRSEKHMSPQSKQQEYSFRLLSFAALLPLARLRRSFEGGLLLVEREEAMPHFPDGIVALFSERQCDFVDDEGPFVAPFARLDIPRRSRDSVSTLVSLEPIVQTLVEVLHNPHSNAPSPAADGTIANGRGEDLESRFRASCFDALLSYNLSGLTFPSLGHFRSLLFFQPSEGIYGVTENFTRLRAALAAFQGVIQDSIASNKMYEMVEQRQDEIHSLVEQLLRLCISSLPEEVISGCKLLIGLFPSITACRPEEHIDFFRQLYQQTLSILMRGARDSLNDARNESSPEAHFRRKKQQRAHLDRGAPLLLLLYETSLYYLELFHHLESDEANALLRLCYDVTSCPHTSRACRTLAVRCAVAVLDRQKENDIEGLMDEYARNQQEDDLSTCGISIGSQLLVPETDIILSALARKSMNLSHHFGQGATDEHFALATEFDNIKLFDRTKESAAAWLCGDHLLTCKIGGATSRNTGWVEIIIRGATFRRRELVRLSSAVSVDNPEIPSSLWGTPNKMTKESENKFSLEAPVFEGDETAMKNALDVLRRCEQLLGPENRSTSTTVQDQELSLDPKSRYSSQADLFSSSSPQYPTSEDSPVPMHALSTQTETFDPEVPEQIDVSDPSSVRSWLLEVLEDPLHVEDVTKRLSEIGFQTILDSCTTKSSINKFDLHPVVRLQVDVKAVRAVNLLDRTVALDTHKIALLFAAPLDPRTKDEEDEVDYLLNVKAASPSFFKFTKGLGELVMTRHLKYFSAGFDTSGSNTDGEYALVWIEHKDSDAVGSTVLTVFHGVPYMPLNVNNRKRHVGNDSVHVVYCEPASFLHEQLWTGGMDEEMENILISGEFGFVTIFVIPVSKLSCRVKVQLRPGLPESTRLQLHYLPGEDIMATDEAPTFVRRLANLADIACSVVMHEKLGPPTSWEIRLRQVRCNIMLCFYRLIFLQILTVPLSFVSCEGTKCNYIVSYRSTLCILDESAPLLANVALIKQFLLKDAQVMRIVRIVVLSSRTGQSLTR